jgi:hypothetical protein
MDLSSSHEREVLRKHIQENFPEDAHLIAHLEDYVRLFRWQDFHTVYQGGLISIKAPNNVQIGVELRNMLMLTSVVVKLEKFKGFHGLMDGFRNPTQFGATAFEVHAAAWCSTRKACRSIEFGPEVEVAGNVKHPDFLWKTMLGDLYCECKQENSADNKATKRILKLSNIVNRLYEQNGPWDTTTRVDVIVQHPAYDGTDQILERVISRAAQCHRSQTGDAEFVEGVVTVKLSKTTDALPDVAGCIQFHHRQLQPHCPEPALSTNARFTVTMSVMAHRLKQLVELVKDARSQLPRDRHGAIFIDIGGSKIFEEKLHNMIAQPAYVNTPWISLWERGQPLKAVIRGGQPFDHRLAE